MFYVQTALLELLGKNIANFPFRDETEVESRASLKEKSSMENCRTLGFYQNLLWQLLYFPSGELNAMEGWINYTSFQVRSRSGPSWWDLQGRSYLFEGKFKHKNGVWVDRSMAL